MNFFKKMSILFVIAMVPCMYSMAQKEKTSQKTAQITLLDQINDLNSAIVKFIQDNELQFKDFFNQAGALRFTMLMTSKFLELENYQATTTDLEQKIKELQELNNAFTALNNNFSRLTNYFTAVNQEYNDGKKGIDLQLKKTRTELAELKAQQPKMQMKKTENLTSDLK